MDALEFDLPQSHRGNNASSISPPATSSSYSYGHSQAFAAGSDDAAGDTYTSSTGTHTFKVVTTKRTLLLCAPSEEEEIKWLSAVRALIARRSGAGVVPGDVDAHTHIHAHATTLLGSSNLPSTSIGPIPISDAGQMGAGMGMGTSGGTGVAAGSIASASVTGAGGTSMSSSAGHHHHAQQQHGRRRGDSIVRRLSLSGGGTGSSSVGVGASVVNAAGSGAATVGGSSGTIVASAPGTTTTLVPQEALSGRQS